MIALAALALAGALAGSPAPAAAPEPARVAVVVGNDLGLPGEQALRFTGADARRLGAVLQELGGFDPANVHLLENRTAAEILDQVEALASGPQLSVFVFYYSGHADAAALHPGGTLLPLDLLASRLRRIPADLRLELLDACQSGAAARAKGSRPASPFSVRVEDQASTGDILVSSSAADEQSFESEHGGLFTLAWTAGLRGAADANADGQVTLSEVYAYAYAQTLRSTLGAATGPQHATFRYALEGHRDPVLTRLAGGGLLTLRPQAAGTYVVFDRTERSVVAELPARADEPLRFALAPGEYVVRLRTTRALRVARVALARDDDRVLAEHQMQEVPLVRLARKGSIGDLFLSLGAGAYASGLGPRGQLLGVLGMEWEGERWVPGLEVSVAGGTERHRGLETRDLLGQLSGQLLFTQRLGTAAVRAGPVIGGAYVRQEPAGHADRASLGVSFGGRLRGDVQITRSVGLYVLADARALALRLATSRGTKLGVRPLYAATAGLRAAF
jgi:hypothetical protein